MASNAICNGINDKPGCLQVNLGQAKPLDFEESFHSREILKGLHQQFKDERFCDVALIFGKKEIKAHKVVLASSSQYFEVMFSSNFVDGTQQRLEINGVGERVGEVLIEFAYTGKIQITSENVVELLAGANFLQGFQTVEKICADYLKQYVEKHNLFQILTIADHFNQIHLKNTLKEKCLKDFAAYVEGDNEGFLNLEQRLVKELIACEELIVCKDGVVLLGKNQEEYILTCVLRYLEHNQLKDNKTAEILKFIRLPLLKKPYLHTLKDNPLLQGKESMKVLEDAITLVPSKKKRKKAKKPLEKPTWAKWRNCGEYQLWRGRRIAAGGQVCNEARSFEEIAEYSYVCRVKLWIRRWDGRPVIGGIEVQFSNGLTVLYGSSKPTEIEEFTLESNERIIKIDSQSGWMVDSLTFYTNTDRKLGPYGGHGGGFRHESPPGLYGYLVGIEGTEVNTQDDLAINKLCFVWRVFRLPNQPSIPDYQPDYHSDLSDDSYDDDLYDDDDFFDHDYYDDFYDIEDENDYDTDGFYGASGYDDFHHWHFGEVGDGDWEAIVGIHEPLANDLDKEVD